MDALLNDDLIPIHTPDEVVIPEGIFRLKRGNDMVAPDGKRQRVFTDAGGAETYVDPALFGDDLYEFGYDDDEEYDVFERDLQRVDGIRLQESVSRGVRGALIVDQAGKQLTKGQKKLKQLVRQRNYTHDDLQEKLVNDDEGIVFLPTVTPRTSDINSTFGPEEDRDDCYGCTRGLGLGSVAEGKLSDLRRLITELYGRTEIKRLCGLVSEWFRTEIMEPCNLNLRKGESKVELWTPRSVFDHISHHMDAADFVIGGLVRYLREDLEIIRSSSVYKVRAETVRNGRKLHPQDIYVHPQGHKMMLDDINLIHKLLSSDPNKMRLFNSTFSITKDVPGVVAAKYNVEVQTRMESVFEGKD